MAIEPSSAIASPLMIGRGRSESTSAGRGAGSKCRVSQRAAQRIISTAAREDAPTSPPPSPPSPPPAFAEHSAHASSLPQCCPRSTLSSFARAPYSSCQVDRFIMSVVHIFVEIESTFRNNQLRFEKVKRNFPWFALNSRWSLAQITSYYRQDSSGLILQLEC